MVRRTLEGVCSDHGITKKAQYAALDEMKSRGLWAGHSVDVLPQIYAKCAVGQDEYAKRRGTEALRQD
jgi:hypothetical protein